MSLNNLLNCFDESNWPTHYLNWELELINNLGFGFELNSKILSNDDNQKICNISIDNIVYKIPTFLIKKNNIEIDHKDIHNGLLFLEV